MSNNFISLNQVTKHYKDPASDVRFQALRGVDLQIKQGSMASIIGPSGAGKSTLLNILGGMVRPSTGTVTIDGFPLHSLSGDELNLFRRKITGFLWQIPSRNLLPNLTALDNVLFAMEVGNFSRQERHSRALELLSQVGLRDRMDHSLGRLSGGEAQRCGLAVALANEPKLLLADEPTGELDSETTMEIISYLQDLNSDLGTTIVVVTHDNRFERMTKQSYNILDGNIAGMRRSLSKERIQDWSGAEREEVGVVNQFGLVRIPNHLREKYNISNYVKFIEDEESGRIYIISADEESD
ncbi:MAG: ABC transporter ATP-binding protein [Candidatus Kariarchaeaceae archaeon]|jgi:ABC-type lipoprotein export system ATPase subunit